MRGNVTIPTNWDDTVNDNLVPTRTTPFGSAHEQRHWRRRDKVGRPGVHSQATQFFRHVTERSRKRENKIKKTKHFGTTTHLRKAAVVLHSESLSPKRANENAIAEVLEGELL